MTYWWFYEKCNAVLDLCTVTIYIMSKSTVFIFYCLQMISTVMLKENGMWAR